MDQIYVVVVIHSHPHRTPDVFGPFSTATEAIRKQDALARDGVDSRITTLIN